MSINAYHHDWVRYDERLGGHVSLKEKSEEKLIRLFHAILNSKIKIAHPSGSDEECRIANLLIEMIRLKPGRELIRRLIKTDEDLFIQSQDAAEQSSCYSSAEKIVKIQSDHHQHSYCGFANGNIFYQRSLAFVSLAHELIHALHHLENPDRITQHTTDKLADFDLQNTEEQHTITGLIPNYLKNGFDLDPLCENLFYKTLGMPIRINHVGISNAQTRNPMFAARLGALLELQSLIDEDPSLLNDVYEVSGNKVNVLPEEVRELYEISGKRLSLLSVAILFKKERILNYLLEKEADIHLEDDLGGPLHAAIAIGDLKMAKHLVSLGAKPRPGYGCLWKLLSKPKDEILPFLKTIPWGETIDEPGSLSTPVFTNYERDLSFTPLMKALRMNVPDFDGNRSRSEIYETVLALGANPAAKSAGGETLLILFLEELQDLLWFGPPIASRPDYDEILEEFQTLVRMPGMDLSACSYVGKTTKSLVQNLNLQLPTC